MRLENVSKSYNGQLVLDRISLDIPDAEATLISGVSGRGKTTLLRLLMGLEKPDSGRVIGVPDSISAVFQEDRLPLEFTPTVCVRMTADNKTTRDTVRSHLEKVGLADHADKPVRELSGGMRRRTAIVRAILAPSRAIFLDEPFTGLDAETKRTVIEYIKENTKGKTLVVVSHAPEDAELLGAVRIEL